MIWNKIHKEASQCPWYHQSSHIQAHHQVPPITDWMEGELAKSKHSFQEQAVNSFSILNQMEIKPTTLDFKE